MEEGSGQMPSLLAEPHDKAVVASMRAMDDLNLSFDDADSPLLPSIAFMSCALDLIDRQ